MADQQAPSSRSQQQASQVDDAKVKDARHADHAPPPGTRTDRTKGDTTTSREHPLSNEPREMVQHADRAPPPDAVQRGPTPFSPEDQARFDELRSKDPNPNVLPPNVRTEEEEMEFRELSKAQADFERQQALEAARPEFRASPQVRLDELKGKGELGEGEAIELRRLEEMVRDEKRIAELQHMDKRVPEEDDELRMLTSRVSDARRNGGYAVD